MFGYPTGLSALLVRREHGAHLLHKTTYFGGGTVDFASDTNLFEKTKNYLLNLKHANGSPVAVVYGWKYGNLTSQAL
uniref:Uncharacterized protein n=1 Tax=Ditylenchus dipsaci TaxID=166011 RepID=A0A915DUW1_9BILA